MAGSNNSKRRARVMSALDQHEGALMRYAARMMRDPDAAKDVVQHAFLKLCDQSDARFPKHPRPWLFKVCRNRIVDLQRKVGQQSESLERVDPPLSVSPPDPAVLAERKDLGDWLWKLVDQLPPSQREVIVLWCQGWRYGEIAKITNQQEGGVRVQAHRGFTWLREHPKVRALLSFDRDGLAGNRTAAVTQHGVTAAELLSRKGQSS